MQELPHESGSRRDDGNPRGERLHELPSDREEGFTAYRKTRRFRQTKPASAVGARLSDSQLRVLLTQSAYRSRSQLPDVPRSGEGTRSTMARDEHQHGRM